MADSDELTLEDYEILGLEPPEELKRGAEPTEPQGEEEPKVTEEGPTLEERFSLIKELGPDKFYEQYPDEAPEGWKPPEPKEKKPEEEPADDLSQIVVTSGEYKGKSLQEVKQEDPFTAAVIYQDFRRNRELEAERTRQGEREAQEAAETELVEFANLLSTKAYKSEFEKLGSEQKKVVEKELNRVLDWMKTTGRGGGRVRDAYVLMSQEGGKEKAKTLVDLISGAGAVPSVSGGDGGGHDSTDKYSQYENMDPDQFGDAVARMPDREFQALMREAPSSLRQKYPSIPWSQ